ncbi:ribonuclease H-like domain-containing protein [Tanacetum coccineum]|uniref:Ribonuclease H-like domain-containing protein n=1 Tax=Tanacetum coccineum TaxID=301880 RepID=A0ABQ4YMT4_9ASTR
MWLFRHKYHADDTLSHYKAHLMANGSTQLEGVDVDETFSLVVKSGNIQIVLSLATSQHWPVYQLDIKNAFLHGDLSETSLYGLKQSPRAWFQRVASYITRVGFLHSLCDSSLFIYKQGTDTAYLLLYVDDIVLTTSSETLLQQVIGLLHQEFSMTNLGLLNYFLGVSVMRDSTWMFLSQHKYAVEILKRTHMVNVSLVGYPVDTMSKPGIMVILVLFWDVISESADSL